MSATDTLESGVLGLILNNANIANIGDATGLRGSQTTSETAYTSYARVAISRAGAGWTISGTSPTNASNAAAITFPTCGATGSTITHFGIGTSSSGAGVLLFKGALSSFLAASNGVTPSFAIGDLDVNGD